jgi:long-chain acyl-CoA synthetase
MTNVTTDDIAASVRGQTVANGFASNAAKLADRVVLRWRDGDDWAQLTWRELADKACRVAAGLASMGVGRGDRVALMMRNSPEFHIADLGALLVGATPFSIYNSSSAEQVAYLVEHAAPKAAVVEADFAPRFPTTLPAVGVEDLTGNDPVDLDEASRIAQPDDLATLIYTSGTTGPPKGVMITHANVCWTNESLVRSFERSREDAVGWRLVSYLPMAHIAERQTSHYGTMLNGYEVTTCPDAAQVAAYLRDVHPQLLFGVPRVWEKIQAGVEAALSANPEQKKGFDEAVAAAIPLVAKRTLGGGDGALTEDERTTLAFLDEVAFAKVRGLVGLDALEFAITGAAPISVELVEWYRAIGVPFSEIYGMSENTGPLTWEPHRVKPGYVGRALPGVEVRLAEDGEVLGRGGNIFVGYLNDPEKTAEALDADGWLHTGDIGEMDDDGYLRIVDRKKELIINAAGKNMSPANIEAALKSFPLIGQAAVIGDRRPYIAALVVLDPDVAPGWAKQHGIEGAPTLAELAEHPVVHEEIERNVAETNARFSQVEQVKRFRILGAEWLPDSDELTPTMKLKRRGINQRYAEEIEALYS